MANVLPPPPINDKPGSFTWLEWYRQLRNYVATSGSVPWYIINFAGSNIRDLALRSHADLQGLQGGAAGNMYHLTQEKHDTIMNGLAYGAFSDTTTQTQTAINTAKAITYNTVDLEDGVTKDVTVTSKIICPNTGIYNFQFSLQLYKSSAGVGNVYIWARKNGTDVPNSASKVAIQGSTAETVAAWNFMLNMTAGDYFELMWSADSTACQVKQFASAAPVPVIPSAILTVSQVNL